MTAVTGALELIQIRRMRPNKRFDGLTDDVRVVLKMNGKQALTGHYKVEAGRGIVTMSNGDRYWFFAGDLYRLEGVCADQPGGLCCTWNPKTQCFDCTDGSTKDCKKKPKPRP